MESHESLKRALAHEPGTLPVDFGSNAVTGIHVQVVEALREHYDLAKRPVKVVEPYQMLGEVDAELRQAMGVDVVGVFPPNTMFGFPLADWKEWRAPWGQDLLVPGDFNVSYDGKDVFMHPQGDTSAPASAHMPEGGYFFDTVIRQEPIKEDELDPSDNTEEFGYLSEADLEHFRHESQKARQTGCGVIANFGGTAFGDIALVPAPFLKHPKGIRDITEWYISTAMRQDYVHAVFTKQLEYALANMKQAKDAVGDNIDAVFICGTDFGTQDSQFCSPETFDELWLPYYKKLNDWIHENTSWKTFKHCCGAAEPLLPNLIKAGFDVINPVQCSAAGMDPQPLKDKYGEQLVFWGGGVDTQKTLPFGTPEQVRSEVLERCRIFSDQGGFVFNAIHNVQAKTPIENMVAMLAAVGEFKQTT